jgi:hypothetical protein
MGIDHCHIAMFNGLDNRFFHVYRKMALSAYYAPCPCLKDAAAAVEVNNP